LLTDCAAHSDEHSRCQPQEHMTSQRVAVVTRSPDPPAPHDPAVNRNGGDHARLYDGFTAEECVRMREAAFRLLGGTSAPVGER
jgi:hypothetical protein